MRTVPLNLIACSVPVGVTDYSSSTFEDTRISPAAILYLADHTYSAHLLSTTHLARRSQWTPDRLIPQAASENF